MNNVLTLIGPANEGLEPKYVDRIKDVLKRSGANVAEQVWLDKDIACDMVFDNLSAEDADQIARNETGTAPIDLLVQPVTNRRKKLLIADMDSTIINGETLDDLAEFAGIGSKIAEITARAMNGEILFRDALRERMAMLRGLDAAYLDKTADALQLNPGAETLVRTMSAHGAYTALVSGGFRFFTNRVANWIGFDFNKGNDIEIINDRFTGEIIDPIVTKAVKQETLEAMVQERQIEMIETLAVGDGANDLPMLQTAGLGVAYHAKPIVISQTRARVEHTDLTTLLYFQGYRSSEFITGTAD